MSADSLDIPISHLIRWGGTATTLAPTGAPSLGDLAPFIIIAGVLVILAATGLGFLVSWAWRGFP